MKVVLVARAGPIAPFGVAVDDCPVGDTTFGADRAASLVRLGLTPPATKIAADAVITGPALVIGDDTWITRRALAAFVRAARTSTSTLALPPSRLTELFAPLQDTEAGFPCAFVPAGTSLTAAEAFAAPPLPIAFREIPVALPVPRYLLGKDAPTMVWPLTSTVALRVRHWVHVLRASHLAPQVWLLERALRDPLRSALRLALGVRPSAAARQAAWRRQFRFVGRGSVVHPSAVVEGSVIGAGVTIGPHAVVLQSVVGDGCVIEQRAHLSQCTLGPRTFVSLNSSLSACVTFGDTDACANNLQACVIGPRVEVELRCLPRNAVLTRDSHHGWLTGPVSRVARLDGMIRQFEGQVSDRAVSWLQVIRVVQTARLGRNVDSALLVTAAGVAVDLDLIPVGRAERVLRIVAEFFCRDPLRGKKDGED